MSKREKYREEHLLSLCEWEGNIPTLEAQKALNELCRYFLGEDWYCIDPTGTVEQVNAIIVKEIEERFRGHRLRKIIIYK